MIAFLPAVIVAVAGFGAGYGGTTDVLAVEWETGRTNAVPISVSSFHPSLEAPKKYTVLAVSGYGFRARSRVTVAVGSQPAQTGRADQSGQFSYTFVLPADSTPESLPGQTVVASGVNPAGTAKTVIGAVPPLPAGTSTTVLAASIVTTTASFATVILTARSRRALPPKGNLP